VMPISDFPDCAKLILTTQEGPYKGANSEKATLKCLISDLAAWDSALATVSLSTSSTGSR
jgi:hypothetical protein